MNYDYNFKYFLSASFRTDGNSKSANLKASIYNNLMEVPAGDSRWESLIPQAEMDANPLMAGQQNPL